VIDRDHPFYCLNQLFKNENAIFSLSKYVYTADTLFDERELIEVESENLTENWLKEQVTSLNSNQELAFHSLVKLNGRNYHIPMIDFSLSDDFNSEIYDRMSRYLSKKILLNMSIYFSGRSYHAYSTSLLSPKEWLDFMGRLLLINPPQSNSIIDSRWIGHRLIGGYSSLRWTNNSKQYMGMPKRIKYPL
jgi:hypothetical protein